MTVKELKKELNELRGCDEMEVIVADESKVIITNSFTIEVIGTSLYLVIDPAFLEDLRGIVTDLSTLLKHDS